MKLQCPRCEEAFNAKANARRVRCPACGFRQDTPEDGYPASRKSGQETFVAIGGGAGRPAPASAGLGDREKWIIAGLVLVVLGVAAWYFLGGHGDKSPAGSTAATGTACGTKVADLSLTYAGDPVVEMKTAQGCMALELYQAQAPKTVANFLTYTNDGYYDGNLITRISKGFVLQAGGGDAATDQRKTATHPAIVNEAFSSHLKNLKYTLSMARGPSANSAQAEFFINLRDNTGLDATADGNGYAVFGKVVQGQDIVEKIHQLPVTTSSAHPYCVNLEDGQGGSCPVTPLAVQDMQTASAGGSSSAATQDPCAGLPETMAHADLITPGQWNVSSDQEAMFAWIHNAGTKALPYTWSITGQGGAALPTGWSVTFANAGGNLPAAPCGQYAANAYGSTMVSLTIPSSQTAGDVKAELQVGGVVTPFTFHVQATRGTVSHSGQFVKTAYDVRHEDGSSIEKGNFCHELGGTGAVKGYAFGLIGVAKGETVTLVVPPAFAYDTETLTWIATITDFAASC